LEHEDRSRNLEVAVGAAEILTAEPSNIDRIAVDIKARGAESLIGIWSSPIVTQQIFVGRNPLDIFDRKQIFVGRNPLDIFDRKLSPTIGANGLAK